MLNYHTVTPLLVTILKNLMGSELFTPFRLVGGTNLSLREGHRISIDIDMFTDAEYGSIDFTKLETYLQSNFYYYDCPDPTSLVGFGRSYYIGTSKDSCIKLDLMYTDTFINPPEIIDGIRFASVEDIMAMKLQAICTGGRKKDFWDIHMLLEKYSLEMMINCYIKRHPWESSRKEICEKLMDFKEIDDDFSANCLWNKDWDLIKLDIIDTVTEYLDKVNNISE